MKEEVAYESDFEFFLDHTDEKAVLQDGIMSVMPAPPVSMLDIGAGNGLLSFPISQSVEEYIAVEPHANFAENLREKGLSVIQECFPLQLTQKFNFILMSHFLPYENFQPVIQAAWDALENNGLLLIITYRGQTDDWTELMRQLGESPEENNRVGYNQIVRFLHSLGRLTVKKAVTHVKTDNLQDMILALSFVASDGIPEKKDKFLRQLPRLQKLLDSKYRNSSGIYLFPFSHYFLETRKSARSA